MQFLASTCAGLGRAVARAVVAATAAACCAAAFGAPALVVGAKVTYREPSGQAWCATVSSIEIGIAGTPIAWLTIDADPRRIVPVPLSDLSLGCAP
jgi:hypothetical protein